MKPSDGWNLKTNFRIKTAIKKNEMISSDESTKHRCTNSFIRSSKGDQLNKNSFVRRIEFHSNHLQITIQ